MNYRERLAERARHMKSSRIRELMPYLSRTGMISLGGGYPDPRTFAFRDVGITFASGENFMLTGDEAVEAFQYGPTAGERRLVRHILSWHNGREASALDETNCAVLNGSQEGLFILSCLFLEEEDSVVIAEPAYPGVVMACSPFTRQIISVDLDDEGMLVSDLWRILTRRRQDGKRPPKFIYTVPCGHNPSGTTLSYKRRRALLAVAEEFDMFIVEDDPYRLIQLDGRPNPPTIQSMDGSAGRVIRLDSFSKILSPGLRIGYATGHPEVIRMILLLKQSINLQTGMLPQAFVEAFFNTHSSEQITGIIDRNSRFYRGNRDRMIETACTALPDSIRFHVPSHGFFIWFQLPDGYDTGRMIREDSRRLGVLLVPGTAFSIHKDLRNFMRAGFAATGESEVELGMHRFSEMVLAENNRAGKER